MTDDAQQEIPDTPENESEDQSSIISQRRARGNREDAIDEGEPDRLDQLREQFSSRKTILLCVGLIIGVALIAGVISQEAGPAAVDQDWDEVSKELLLIQEELTSNTFNDVLHNATAEGIESPAAKGWLQLEIGVAMLNSSIQPIANDTPQNMMFSQPKPSIVFGKRQDIENRVTNLNDAYGYLENAITSFQAADGDNPLVGLGQYRANYAAAYIKEGLMILGPSADFETNTNAAKQHLESAASALPNAAPSIPDSRRSSTDTALANLEKQINDRLAALDSLSKDNYDPNDAEPQIKADHFYSWLNSYIKQRHTEQEAAQAAAKEAAAQASKDTSSKPTTEPAVDPDRESPFESNDESSATPTDESTEPTTEGSPSDEATQDDNAEVNSEASDTDKPPADTPASDE